MMTSMIPLPLARGAKRVTPQDAHRIAYSCSHVTVPAQPAASGYRYHDLRGDTLPFYVKRMALGDRSVAVTLRAPIELSAGDDAERGAAGLARCELTVGLRRIPWQDVLTFTLHEGESAILAQRAMDEVVQLNLLEAGDCPVCAAATG
jgi:hypothetical protein